MNEPQKNPHAIALGRLGARLGGQSRSPAKRASSRANGKLGGRPKIKAAKPNG